jgi:isopenicillin N synthase-like dioxygenase
MEAAASAAASAAPPVSPPASARRVPQRQRPDAEPLDAEECIPSWLVCEGSEPPNAVRLATWEWQDGKYWRELPDALWPKLELGRRAGGAKVDVELIEINMGAATGAQPPDCRWTVDTGAQTMTHVFTQLSRAVRRNTCYRAVWEWNRQEETAQEGEWVPYAKGLQRVLEDAYETGERSVQYSVQPASGWVCKHTGTPARLDYTVEWRETDEEDRRVYTQIDDSRRTRPVRRRVCCPTPIFNLEELADVTKDGERTKVHQDFCDAIHRPGFAVIRVEPGTMPAPSLVYSLWKPFFHHTPKSEKEKMAVRGSGAMSSITGSGWVGNKESAEHFEIGMKEEGRKENVPWPRTASQIEQVTRELQQCCSRVCRAATKTLEQGAEGTADMWPQQWGNDVHSDRSKWNSLREVAWDQSLWHSFGGTVRSCQRINFFRTTKPADVMLRPSFGTSLHQDLGLVTVVVKGLGGGLVMHPRGTEFQYDISDWVSAERVVDEDTDVIVFGGIQLESATLEYYHAAVHGTMAPAAGPEEEKMLGTQTAAGACACRCLSILFVCLNQISADLWTLMPALLVS